MQARYRATVANTKWSNHSAEQVPEKKIYNSPDLRCQGHSIFVAHFRHTIVSFHFLISCSASRRRSSPSTISAKKIPLYSGMTSGSLRSLDLDSRLLMIVFCIASVHVLRDWHFFVRMLVDEAVGVKPDAAV